MTQQSTPTAVPARNGFGVTALVLGIVGVVFGFIPLTGAIALILGIIGLVFGILGLRRVRQAVADNKVMSWFGTGLSALAIVLGIVGLVILNDVAEDLNQDLQDIGGQPVPTTGADTAPDSDAIDDASVQSCTDGQYGLVTAQVKITNSGDEMATYSVELEALDESGARVGSLAGFVNSLRPGQSTVVEATGQAEGVAECRLLTVSRF